MAQSESIYSLHSRVKDRISKVQAFRNNGEPVAIQDTFELVKDFDLLVGKLYQLRATHSAQHPLRLQVEDLMANLARDFDFARHAGKKQSVYRNWLRSYRQVWREEVTLFLFCFFYFAASSTVGWVLALYHPEFLSLIMPQGAMENVLDHTPWFKGIQNSPVLSGIGIAVNNIKVSFNCFIWSALLGVGGFVILCFNGVFFGGIFGFCYKNGFDQALLDFVVSHGPLELTIIIASAFAGLLFGRVFFMRPYRLFRQRIREGARRAGIVLLGILPWLVIAATFEVFVSPWEYLSFQWKVLSGTALAVLFWTWTFFPETTHSEK